MAKTCHAAVSKAEIEAVSTAGGGVTTFRHSILFLVVILLRYIS